MGTIARSLNNHIKIPFFHINNMCHFEIAFSTSFFSSPWDDWTPNTFASTTKEMPPRMLFSVLIKDVSTLKPPGAIRTCATCRTRVLLNFESSSEFRRVPQVCSNR